MEIDLIAHFGLGRCASSTIQYYLDKNFGPDNRYFGDTKLGLGLAANNILHYNSLFPERGQEDPTAAKKINSIASMLVKQLRLERLQDNSKAIYFSEERVTDSFSYSPATNVKNFKHLVTEMESITKGKISFNIKPLLVIRKEADLLRSYMQNNMPRIIKSNKNLYNFFDNVSNKNNEMYDYFNFVKLADLLEEEFGQLPVVIDFESIKRDPLLFMRTIVHKSDVDSLTEELSLPKNVINSRVKNGFYQILRKYIPNNHSFDYLMQNTALQAAFEEACLKLRMNNSRFDSLLYSIKRK